MSEIPSLRRRTLAKTLDSLPLVVIVVLWHRGTAAQRRRWDRLILVIDAVYTIGLTATAGQTIGERLVRIRVVDRYSGTRPTLPQSALRWLVSSAGLLLAALLPVPRSVRAMEALAPEIERLRKAHHDDGQRLNEELITLYREHDVKPWAGFSRTLLGAAVDGVGVWMVRRSPLKQGPNDLAAKTLVVDVSGRGRR